MNTEQERAFEQILHSVQQAQIPGNDWRRELKLIESTCRAALQPQAPDTVDALSFLKGLEAGQRVALQSQDREDDPLQPAANWLIQAIESCTVADIQGRLSIGYNRAQRLLDHALQSRDRANAEWMTCESRRPWAANTLRERAKDLRSAEKRCRNAFKKDFMGEPARYVADAFGEAAAVFEVRLEAIDHARRAEGDRQ